MLSGKRIRVRRRCSAHRSLPLQRSTQVAVPGTCDVHICSGGQQVVVPVHHVHPAAANHGNAEMPRLPGQRGRPPCTGQLAAAPGTDAPSSHLQPSTVRNTRCLSTSDPRRSRPAHPGTTSRLRGTAGRGAGDEAARGCSVHRLSASRPVPTARAARCARPILASVTRKTGVCAVAAVRVGRSEVETGLCAAGDGANRATDAR